MERSEHNPKGNEDMKTLTEGTRLYNRGDQCNAEHFATIVAVKADRWGTHYKLRIDGLNGIGQEYTIDEREVSATDEGHCGTRIVTKEAYDARRAELFEQHYGIKS